MKILQINSVYGIGSTGRITQDLNNLLKEKGHQSYVAYGRESTVRNDKIFRIGSKLDNYFHVAVTRLFDRHGFASKNATINLTKKIEEINPDIIHLHNIHGYYINIEVLFNYFKKNNKKIIWTLHDCWAFTGHCSYFDYANCNRWLSKCFDCPEKKSYPKSWLLDNSTNNFLRKKEIFTGLDKLKLVTPSNWLANLVSKSFLGEYTVNVINNGINLNKFKPVETNFKENYKIKNKFVILGVASIWNRRKGLDSFLKLSKLLKANEIIVLVGLNKKQIEQLPKNIIGINRTNNTSKLVEIYSAADVFVNPTLEDNFPTTNIEALACGTPIITYDTGGSKEAVNSKTGFVVKKNNISSLYMNIKRILENNKSYCSECVKRARNLYGKRDRFLDYIDLYYSFN